MQIKENNSLKSVQNELIETRTKLDTLRGVDVELRKKLSELSILEMKLQEMAAMLEKERSEKMDLLTEKENLLNKYETEKVDWISQNEDMKKQVSDLNDRIKLNKKSSEGKNI